MIGLDHIKRQSKKVDVDRNWLDYYTGRPSRKMRGQPNRRVTTINGREYHYTKGYRKTPT